MNRLYSISQMAATYHTTLRALRFYEQVGLLAPDRVDGQRFYTLKDRIRLELIIKGKRLGFTLAEIKRLVEAMAEPAGRTPQPSDLLSVLGPDAIARLIEELEEKRDRLEGAISELNQRSS